MAFIGVGAMVGEVAGAAVWVSFPIAGGIALLQGYSFAKFGARYLPAASPSHLPRAGDRDNNLRRVALGVFGMLTVDKVISSGGTALAVAAEPTLGRASYWLMSVTALFSTAGATNAGLYPAAGLCEQMAAIGQFPRCSVAGSQGGHRPDC